ncbi:hypothetical protein EJB05_43981, partial [Eragrostis curvula]
MFGGALGGGCAYFVLNLNWAERLREMSHSFEDGSTAVVEELPAGQGWDDDTRMTWLIPQPSGVASAHALIGIRFVTVAIMCEPDDVIAALDGEEFYGNVLGVKFGKERPKGPFLMSLLAPN